jgi:hypothetical protein
MMPFRCPSPRRRLKLAVRWGAGLCLGLATAISAPGAAGVGGATSLVTPPAAGHYDAQLCVSVNSTPPRCGPVTVELGNVAGLALVRVSDIAYRLEPYGEQLGVTLFHGNMQIDGFFATYRWQVNELLFVDPEKSTRYELKLGTRRFDPP